MRNCKTCDHLKRTEINKRLAAGEPTAQIARDYGLTPSSLHRHRTNCLKLGSSNEIKKEAARGTAALTLLPSKETLNGSLAALCGRIDEIIAEAKQKGSLDLALRGLNSIRLTIESQARLAGHLQPAGTQVNVSVQNNTAHVTAAAIAERLIQRFDKEPELKARIAETLMEDNHVDGATNNSGAS